MKNISLKKNIFVKILRSYNLSLVSYKSIIRFRSITVTLYSYWISKEFKHYGAQTRCNGFRCLKGGQYISLGNKTTIGANCRLTAWDSYSGDSFNPKISIGDQCSIGDDSHITAINSIIIGNNVLTGGKILITDNSHGDTTYESIEKAPSKRKLSSKGPVIIGDNVWIGEKASILPGVRIGKGAIIAANTVVTKNVPDYCVVAGNPEKIVKSIRDCFEIY